MGSLGLVGPDDRLDGLGLWLALQTAVLHSPREVSIAAAVDPDQRQSWEWLKWIPHARTDSPPLAGPHLVDATLATQDLLERVTELVSTRNRDSDPTDGFVPALLLFLDEDLVGERAAVSEILERGPDVGVYTIWLGHVKRGLPGECRSIALLDPMLARLTFIQAAGAEQIADVAADAVAPNLVLETARSLASIRDIGAPGTYGRSAPRTDGVREFSHSDRLAPADRSRDATTVATDS